MSFPVVTEIESAIRALEGTPGACLYYAHHVATVLYRRGLRPIIQAGSLQWPRVRPVEDDGKNDTHFAYMWIPGSLASRAAWAMGMLPEMHVWVGIIEGQQIIDFSTRNLKSHARAAGLEWTADDPPPYLWAVNGELPDWVVYMPEREATILAASVLWKLFKPDYLMGKQRLKP